MADANKVVMSVITTKASRIVDLPIKNGQLVFIQDKQRIALDFNDKRVFYNQIILLDTEDDRVSMLAPVNDMFYFVLSEAVLYHYHDGWTPLTTKSEDIVFIGGALPIAGSSTKLYTNTTDKTISVWNSETTTYDVVADATIPIPEDDIYNLFNGYNDNEVTEF